MPKSLDNDFCLEFGEVCGHGWHGGKSLSLTVSTKRQKEPNIYMAFGCQGIKSPVGTKMKQKNKTIIHPTLDFLTSNEFAAACVFGRERQTIKSVSAPNIYRD